MNLIDYKKKYIKYKKKYILLKGGDGTKIFINNFEEPKLNHICNKIDFNQNFSPESYYTFNTKNLNLKPIKELEKYVSNFMYLCNKKLPNLDNETIDKKITRVSSYKFLLKLNDEYKFGLLHVINKEYKKLLSDLKTELKKINIESENLEIIFDFYIKKKFINIKDTRDKLSKYLEKEKKKTEAKESKNLYGNLNYYYYDFKNYLEKPDKPNKDYYNNQEDLKFKYVEEIADGNCYFYVIVRHLYGNSLADENFMINDKYRKEIIKDSLYEKAVKLLRIDVGLFFLKNFESFSYFEVDINYIADIMFAGSWADDNTNLLLSFLIQKKIHVYSSEIGYNNFKEPTSFTPQHLIEFGLVLNPISKIKEHYEKSESPENIFTFNHTDQYGKQVVDKFDEILSSILEKKYEIINTIEEYDKKLFLIDNFDTIVSPINLFLFYINYNLIKNESIDFVEYDKDYNKYKTDVIMEINKNILEKMDKKSYILLLPEDDMISIIENLTSDIQPEKAKAVLPELTEFEDPNKIQKLLVQLFTKCIMNIINYIFDLLDFEILKKTIDSKIQSNVPEKTDDYYKETLAYVLLFPPRGGHFSSLIPI